MHENVDNKGEGERITPAIDYYEPASSWAVSLTVRLYDVAG